ncbi:MAG TPA: deoxyguanosinetriphosphate triphosphohydrolase [Candidatus Acidoferrales bacterium]|nr:deoxyguanosinetriphosphate triphosphohydrolase [Candidatus Acidoferrales bacterium]
MTPALYAMDVRQSRGRRFPEPAHPYRNDYARDRDRIIHSRAFRRLEAKTQVFTTRYSDHFRNRLTHTLEVAQIARTVAAALGLNADLAEALALAHDIGHPPFGHAGEQRLDQLMRRSGDRFEHNRHALRIVESFEQRYLDFPGLNLTFEVREGIVKHSRDYSPAEAPDLADYLLDQLPPLEAQVIDLADEIAYNVSDADDAFEARLVEPERLASQVELFATAYQAVDVQYPQGGRWMKVTEALRRTLNRMVTDLIDNTRLAAQELGARSVEDIRRAPRRLAAFSPAMAERVGQWKRFLTGSLYEHPAIVEDRQRLVDALDRLFRFFLEHPERMPGFFADQARQKPVHRVVCDYIAGMTDTYLIHLHEEWLGASPGNKVA